MALYTTCMSQSTQRKTGPPVWTLIVSVFLPSLALIFNFLNFSWERNILLKNTRLCEKGQIHEIAPNLARLVTISHNS